MKEKGFQFANVTHEIKDVPGGPKLVHLTFNHRRGPESQDPQHRLRRQQGDQRQRAEAPDEGQQRARRLDRFIHLPTWVMGVIGGKDTYQEAKFDDDAEKIVEYYRDRGYIKAVVGAPEVKVLEDSDDKKTR